MFLVQEKIEILSEKLERESYLGDRPNTDYIEFESTGKNSKVKCKYVIPKYCIHKFLYLICYTFDTS